jgi:hypothetical protein
MPRLVVSLATRKYSFEGSKTELGRMRRACMAGLVNDVSFLPPQNCSELRSKTACRTMTMMMFTL